jgi:hypothetical protein
MATNFIVERWTASANAAASRKSFYVLTQHGRLHSRFPERCDVNDDLHWLLASGGCVVILLSMQTLSHHISVTRSPMPVAALVISFK